MPRLRFLSNQALRLVRAMSAAGVATNVSTVAKLRPKTMAVESWRHHWVEGAPN